MLLKETARKTPVLTTSLKMKLEKVDPRWRKISDVTGYITSRAPVLSWTDFLLRHR